jgi:hypothetical protein
LTNYGGGGRLGHGIVYRIETDSHQHHTITPLTHDAAAESMLLPIGMKLPAPWLYLVVLLCIFIMWAVAMRPPSVGDKEGTEGMAVNDRHLSHATPCVCAPSQTGCPASSAIRAHARHWCSASTATGDQARVR